MKDYIAKASNIGLAIINIVNRTDNFLAFIFKVELRHKFFAIIEGVLAAGAAWVSDKNQFAHGGIIPFLR